MAMESVVHYFNARRSLGRVAQANRSLHTPHVAAKLAASMTKASAHNMRSFNREKEYSATWASQFFPLPHEAYWPQSSITLLTSSDLRRKGSGRPRSTRLRNGMDSKEGRRASLCGICKKSGHYQKTYPSRPRKRPAEP
ncbi:hypothetical protein CTI12_AA332130 [Artemisia annua]|uniref:Uncharacterized protein n=1 Tax=Artemisia annua TaxID=35608 RepID=A0A2U1MWG2_ARTAN|nr:hypothetical protein CTI12_AA332130 [Artemisia annua]